MDTTLVAFVAAAVPTSVIGLLGWSLRTSFEEFRSVLRGLVADVKELAAAHGASTARMDVALQRIATVEQTATKAHDRIDELEKLLRERRPRR